jgi:hypothetical protein
MASRRKDIAGTLKRGKLDFLFRRVLRVLDQEREGYAFLGVFDIGVVGDVGFDVRTRPYYGKPNP